MTAALRYVAVAGAVLALAAVTATAGTAGAVHGLRTYSTPRTGPLVTAIADPALFVSDQKAAAFTMTRAAGATYARVAVAWKEVAPAVPPDGFAAGDPSSPGYSWGALDAVVKAAERAGLTPILDISRVPAWAFSRRPNPPNGGTPKIAALGEFARALALHFDGGTPGVPAERIFQVWNEPNLSLDLDPVRGSVYRRMVNAVADAVHGVDPANRVVAGALEPYAHPKRKHQAWSSVAPLAFMRSLLCLSKGGHPHATCHDPVRFDVWAHNPYTHGGPFGKAKLRDDVALGDLPRMRALLQAGIRLHHVVSRGPVQFWVTEFGWDTNPPRPHAASLGLAARWTAESLYQMWRSRVSLVTWYLLQDYPSPSPYQSGFYFGSPSIETAQPKPGLTAFRFPFVAYLHGRSVHVWGRDKTSDRRAVTILLRHGRGSWRPVAKVVANSYGIFVANLRLKASRRDSLRAIAPGSGGSLAFSLKVPRARNIGPWGT